METKVCTKCNKTKTFDSFSWKDKPKERLSTICKECHKKYRYAYYRNNKDSEQERIYIRKKEIRKWFNEYRASLSCSKCGESHPACIVFHHRNPKEKDMEVSKMASGGWSKIRVKNEVSKCDTLCSNCHKKLHWKLNERV